MNEKQIEELKEQFGKYADLLRFDAEESVTMILVYPKEFLGFETFSEIAKIVRRLNGKYVSQGLKSHFQFAKETVYVKDLKELLRGKTEG